MEKATLTISLPRTMKDFIALKLLEGRFSTPSEYIRSLIRVDQDLNGKSELAALVCRMRYDSAPREREDGDSVEVTSGRRAGLKRAGTSGTSRR